MACFHGGENKGDGGGGSRRVLGSSRAAQEGRYGGPARGREQDKYGYYTFFKLYYKYFSPPSGLVSLGGSVLNIDTNNTLTAINCLLGVALKKKIRCI